eukprot:GDKJ01020889.1.p1 GENE.GDKJ01020889.1~~GDKJ01020889.1.p1  ORF type:complete len:143 (+),score=29.41 GDKJ01020889.1:34-462(+)
MSFMLPHLHTGYAVDQACVLEENRVVILRFGRDDDRECMQMDEVLYKISEEIKEFAAIYLVDIDEVSDFNQMYELSDPMSLMFFYRNKHILVDCGTGNTNKINFPITNTKDMIAIIETVFRGARKGRGIVSSPIDYSSMRKF